MVTDTGRADLRPPGARRRGAVLVDWLTTTDHKKIGHLYLITAFGFFLVGGLLALVMRAELARPGLQIINAEQYNQALTMHGTIMLLLFATPPSPASRTRSCRCRSARPMWPSRG